MEMTDGWRIEALKRLPQLTDMVETARDLSDLCLDLSREVWDAYYRAGIIGDRILHAADDEQLLAAIYDYAGWCLLTPEIFRALERTEMLARIVGPNEVEQFAADYWRRRVAGRV